MDKIKNFLKNYRKILIVAAVSLIVVAIISAIYLFIDKSYEIYKNNAIQLEKINNKVDEVQKVFNAAQNIEDDSYSRQIELINNIIRLEPEDVMNSALLNKYVERLKGVKGIVILDADRCCINSSDGAAEIDYSDPYYDQLFDITQNEYADLYHKDDQDVRLVSAVCNDSYLILQFDKKTLTYTELGEKDLWKIASNCVGVDSASTVVVVSNEDNKIIYAQDKSLIGNEFVCTEVLDSVYITEDKEFLVNVAESYDGTRRICAITSINEILTSYTGIFICILILFLIAIVIMTAYIVCLRQGELDPEDEYTILGKNFLKSQTKAFAATSLIVGIAVFCIILLMTNISDNISSVEILSKESEYCADIYENVKELYDLCDSNKNSAFYDCGRVCSDFLSVHEDYCCKQGLSKLAQAAAVKYITIFDDKGNTVSTSSPLDNLNFMNDPESTLYELRYTLEGKEGVRVTADTSKMEEGEVIYAVPRRNSEGIASGAIAFTTDHGFSNNFKSIEYDDSVSLIEKERINDQVSVIIVDGYGVIIGDDLDVINGLISENELNEENTFKDGYLGKVKIDNINYSVFVKPIESEEKYIYVIMQSEMISLFSVKICLVIMLLYVLMILWMWYDGLGSKYHFERQYIKKKDADDWERTELNWDELTTPQKMSKIINVCIYAVSVLIIAIYLVCIITGNRYDTAYLIGKDTYKSVNPYTILINIIVALIGYTLVKFIIVLINKMEILVGTEGTTACRLAASLIKYIGAIVCLFIIAINFGLDPVATIASIGIMGFGITLGAQDLIKDMVAGTFIIFEGNFKVGDMLLVNGEWYWIKAIGVRTTTLDAWGRIKVINNSQMSNIVNIQNSSACVDCDIFIGIEYDTDAVEEILVRELPLLKEHYPEDIATPEYKGIQALKGSGTTLRIRTYCPPVRQGRVGRMLRKDVKHILDENGIMLALDAYEIRSTGNKSDGIYRAEGNE